MTTVTTLTEAEDELSAAAVYYEERRAGLGIELVMAVDDALEVIAEQPRALPHWRDDRRYRRYALRRFPYVIFYMYDEERDAARVVAVAHAKRRPGYWLARV